MTEISCLSFIWRTVQEGLAAEFSVRNQYFVDLECDNVTGTAWDKHLNQISVPLPCFGGQRVVCTCTDVTDLKCYSEI